jgi:hypothetical protein
MKFSKYFVIYCILFHAISFAQPDSINNISKYQFTPKISGGQIEATTILYVLEFGGFVDLDFITKADDYIKSFGIRLSIEYYSYFEAGGPTGGGPFTDYCLYGRYTSRMNDFRFTILGGIANHTYDATDYEDKLLFRAGLEFKYNLVGNCVGLLLKGSTSFQEQTTFVGLGIFIGYFE